MNLGKGMRSQSKWLNSKEKNKEGELWKNLCKNLEEQLEKVDMREEH